MTVNEIIDDWKKRLKESLPYQRNLSIIKVRLIKAGSGVVFLGDVADVPPLYKSMPAKDVFDSISKSSIPFTLIHTITIKI